MDNFEVDVSDVDTPIIVADDPDIVVRRVLPGLLNLDVQADDALHAAQKVVDVLDDYSPNRLITVYDQFFTFVYAEDPGTGEVFYVEGE